MLNGYPLLTDLCIQIRRYFQITFSNLSKLEFIVVFTPHKEISEGQYSKIIDLKISKRFIGNSIFN
jgi:hypothetical protein